MESNISKGKNQQEIENREQNRAREEGVTVEANASKPNSRQTRRAKLRQEERLKEQERKEQEKIEQVIQRVRSDWRKEGLSTQEIKEREESVRAGIESALESGYGGLSGKTWRELEVGRKFTQNEKIKFCEDAMIVGVDIGKTQLSIRCFDSKGMELGQCKAYEFGNDGEGMDQAICHITAMGRTYNKAQIVVGCEPTGHYWNNMYFEFTDAGYTVVLVNPNAVKASKELDDNNQLKSDQKDPKVIAGLVKDGRYSIPYFPEGTYAELRVLGRMGQNNTVWGTRVKNQMICWVDKCFPELIGKGCPFEDVEAASLRALLKAAPLPDDVISLGVDGINEIFKGIRNVGRKKAEAVYKAARGSIGHSEAPDADRYEIKVLCDQLEMALKQEKEINQKKVELLLEYEDVQSLLQIPGIGKNAVVGSSASGCTLAAFLGELGDISRFDSSGEIIKLFGLVPVACSSGQHKGEYKISKRGRKRGRYFIITMARCVVMHSAEWQEVYRYYTTRGENRYSPNEAYVAVAAKLIRIIYLVLTKHVAYDAEKMLAEFRHGREQAAKDTQKKAAKKPAPKGDEAA